MEKLNFSELANGYDVIAIGGGAAGCSFLGYLNTEKFRTLLVDYRHFPRKKACSGILVKNAKEYFAGINLPENVFAKPINLDLVYQDWTHSLENSTKKEFINTHRVRLDKWLFSKLEKKSVSIMENTKLIDFFYTKDKKFIVLILEQNGQPKSVVTSLLVGCDGALSTVRKKIYPKHINYYVAIQELIQGPSIDKAYFIFDEEITDFYSWIIPKDKGIEIGTAAQPFKAKDKFNLFKDKVAQRFGIEGSGELQSAIVLRPESHDDICLGKNTILLCGEAAGLISPSSAEGISYALISGKLCAETLNSGSKKPLAEYKEKCIPLLERLEKKFKKSKLISEAEKRKVLFA